MTNESRYLMVGFWTVVFYVFVILSISNCIEILFGWFHSQDVRDLWPLGLSLYSAAAFAYAVAFSALMRNIRRTDIVLIVIYNAVLASLLFLNSYLYYTIRIDWLAVNSHTATLTAFQKIIRSDYTPILIYAMFLFGTVVAGRMSQARREREESAAKKRSPTINMDATR